MSRRRIVSLVPSLTELVWALGLGDELVGRTGFCVRPRAGLREVTKLGGTKQPMMERLRALRPTHLIMNKEENERSVYEQACQFIPNVIVTYPVTLEDNRALYSEFGEVFSCQARARLLTALFDRARARLLSRKLTPIRVLYLIWREPWMTVSRDTFISHMLAEAGLLTVPAGQPNARSQRYPVLEGGDFEALQPEIVLLPSEPFRFGPRHRTEVASLPGMADKPGFLIDGEMTSWYGPRAIRGLRYLARLRDQIDRDPTRTADEP